MSKYISKFFISTSIIVLIYTILLLVLSVNKGFDITDESYYILVAKYQPEIFSILRHDGYLTGFIYMILDYNLSLYRFFGIFILLSTSIWFSLELYKYLITKFNYKYNNYELIIFIVPILAGSLSFYNRWIITPSYNWVVMVSIIITFCLLFRIVNSKSDFQLNIHLILLAIAYNLSFMGKPTSTIILLFISIIFILFEYEKLNLKKILLLTFIYNILFLIIHILFIENSLISYISRITESILIEQSGGGGYGFAEIIKRTIGTVGFYLVKKLSLYKINIEYILLFLFSLVLIYRLKNYTTIKKIFLPYISFILIIYTYFIYLDLLKTKPSFAFIWLGSIEILIFTLMIYLTRNLFFNYDIKSSIEFSKIFILVYILTLGSIAYRFGTNIHFVYSLASGLIFVFAAILIVAYIIDKTDSACNYLLTSLVGLLLTILVVFQILFAYNNPYRIVESIKKQTYPVTFRNNKNQIYVDKYTSKYFNDLKNISNKYLKINQDFHLLDLTGGSPGANVILDAKILGAAWFAGAYKGSNIYAYSILKKVSNAKLKKSWLLIAPNGRRSLDLNILKKLNLNFPSDYKMIGKVRTSHRNEIQEIWVPKIYLESLN